MESARAQWGGLRRGKTDVQTPRTLALEDWLWKDSEGLAEPRSTVQHAVPVGRRIASRIPPGRPRIRPHSRFWRLLAEKIAFQEAFKNRSNFDAILTSILERLGSVFLEAKMAPKSIKNGSKLGFRAFLFLHRFYFDF